MAASVQGLRIEDNTFCRMMRGKFGGTGGAYGIEPGALIWLTQSQDIGLIGNRVYEPGPFFKEAVVEKDGDPAALGRLGAGVQLMAAETCPRQDKGARDK